MRNRAIVGLVVSAEFAGSAAGQLMLEVVSQKVGLSAGCAGLIGGMATLAAGLASSSLALFAGIVVAGTGQGLS